MTESETKPSSAGASKDVQTTPSTTKPNITVPSKPTNLVTSANQGERRQEPRVQEDPKARKFPNINEPGPEKRFQSKSNRVVVTEVRHSDVMFVRLPDGSIETVRRSDLLDSFGEILEETNVRTNLGDTKIVKCNGGAVIVVSDEGVQQFENEKDAEANGVEL